MTIREIALEETDQPTMPIPVKKVVFVGNGGVGKTSILKHLDDRSKDSPCLSMKGRTAFFDYGTCAIHFPDHVTLYQIWDLAGQIHADQKGVEVFQINVLEDFFLRGTTLIFLTFSLYDEESFKGVSRADGWFDRCKTICSKGGLKVPQFVLVGNKADLPCKVPDKVINEWMDEEVSIVGYIKTNTLQADGVDPIRHYLRRLG